MIPVLEAPLTEDLADFTAFLWQHSIPHRVVEERERQVLWVSDQQSPAGIQELYHYWRNGGDLAVVKLQRPERGRRLTTPNWAAMPVTLALVGLSFLFTFMIGFGADLERMAWFSFAPFQVEGQGVMYQLLWPTLASGELWRLVTPIFMHFSVMHILFNLLWVWIVGSRMEPVQGSGTLIGLVLFSALSSNLAQYLVSGPMFGGMSGVVFALLGYSWLWDRQGGQPRLGLPPALMGMMLFWLALGFTGVLEGVGLGSIANTAHLVGLLAGLCWVPLRRCLNRHSG